MEEVKVYKSGAKSSASDAYSLVPRAGLRRVAARFQKGLEAYGEGAYNALAPNDGQVEDREWLTERANHAIRHCFRVIDKLNGKIPIGGDDDAAAVAWFGLVAAEAMERLEALEADDLKVQGI